MWASLVLKYDGQITVFIDDLQEEAQGNADRTPVIIAAGIKSLTQNSVVIDRDAWLKVSLASPTSFWDEPVRV